MKKEIAIVLIFLLISTTIVFFIDSAEVNALNLLSDDFADLSGWHSVFGAWTKAGGAIQGINPSGASLAWTGNMSWTNYQVTANLRILKSGDEASFVVRYNDWDRYYLLGIGPYDHKYSIAKIVDGVGTELASSGLGSQVEVDRWYTLTAVAVCGTLKLLVDGVKVLEVQDDSLSAGAVGLASWDGTVQAQQIVVQSLGWSKTYPADNSNIFSVIQTSDGGYALAGSSGVRAADRDGSGFWLMKTDATGNHLWNHTELLVMYDVAYSIIQTSDGGYALAGRLGSFHANIANFGLLKTDSSGNTQWSGHYEFPYYYEGPYVLVGSEIAYSVVQTSDGGYALGGWASVYNNSADFGLVKTDSSGNKLWDMTYGGTGVDRAYSIVQSGDGGYALAGELVLMVLGGLIFGWLK